MTGDSVMLWPSVSLAEVAELCLGKMLDAKKNKGRLRPYLANPNVRWLEVDTSVLKLMPFEEHEDERYGLRAGDVVVCEGGEAGRAAVWDGRVPDMRFQKAIHRVRPKPSLDARYLVYRLMHDHQTGRLADCYTGATIKHLTGQDLSRYRFPLPPVEEQRRITAILDKANALRANRREALTHLDRLVQSIFEEMFGDPEINERRFPVAELQDLCSRVTDGTHQAPKWEQSGIPFLFISNIIDGKVTFETDKFISRETYDELTRRCRIEAGDVLYTTVGSYGNTAVVDGRREFCFQRHIAHIKPNPALLDSVYCAVMLESPGVRRQVDRCARGVAQKTVNLSDLKTLKVLAPPLEAQHEFRRKADAARQLKDAHLRALRHDEALLLSLEYRAFRGDL